MTNLTNGKAMKSDWEQRALAKRDEVLDAIPTEWRIQTDAFSPDEQDARVLVRKALDDDVLKLTELDAETLLERLANKQVSSEALTRAFSQRAAVAHQVVNCLSEILFEQALEEAKELDAILQKTGKTVGPLHGLPITVKDAFRVRGANTAVGFVAWLDDEGKATKETESKLVQQLRSLGAVIFAKTTVPTSLMAIETESNIYGYTYNAVNRSLSTGGSSGGEAALQALHASPLGFGTDIGASIRLPASFNGVWGLRPSHGRLAGSGVRQSMNGQTTVASVVGPLTAHFSSLLLATKLLLQPSYVQDVTVLDLPWRQSAFDKVQELAKTKSLTFAVLRNDGLVRPSAAVTRALERTVTALKKAGYEVIEWSPPAHGEGFGILWDMFAQDGGEEIHDTAALSGETLVKAVTAAYGEQKGHLSALSLHDVWRINERRIAFQEKYATYWRSTAKETKTSRPVDGLLLPVAPTPAWLPGKGIYPGYTGIFNVLDYTSVAVPTGVTCDAEKDRTIDSNESQGDFDKMVADTYDPSAMHGAPVGVQLVGQRLEEEKVLSLAHVVQQSLAAAAVAS